MLTYSHTILYVEDVEATMDFYEEAFRLKKKFISPEKDYGEMISGETTIAFASLTLGNANFLDGFQASSRLDRPFGIELTFTSNRITTDFKRALLAGASVVSAIARKPWGQRVCYLRDNNGFLIEICTAMKK